MGGDWHEYTSDVHPDYVSEDRSNNLITFYDTSGKRKVTVNGPFIIEEVEV